MPVLLVIAVGALLRLHRIGDQPLWVDEASSLRFARQPLGELWSWGHLVDPGNPPLYYSILRGWMGLGLGDGEAILRLPSALFGILTIPVVYSLGRTIGGRRLGFASALLIAISPFQVRYAQEARAYALLTLAAAVAMWGVARLLRDPARSGAFRGAWWTWGAYVVGTSVALLAHNTAVFLVIGANLVVVGAWWTRGRVPPGAMRTWALAQVAVFVVWGAWLPGFVRQALDGQAFAWIPAPTFGGVVSGVYALYAGGTRGTPYVLEAVGLAALFGLGLWSWRRERRWIAFALAFALTPVVGEILVSLWRPIFLRQTLLWAGVPICLTMAAGVLSLTPRVMAIAVAALVVFAGFGLHNHYDLYQKEAWDQVARYVDRRVQPGDAIVFSVGFLRIPFDHYFVGPSDYSVPEIEPSGGPGDVFVVREATKTRSRVWLIVSHPESSADGLLPALAEDGQLVELARFADVDVYLFASGRALGSGGGG